MPVLMRGPISQLVYNRSSHQNWHTIGPPSELAYNRSSHRNWPIIGPLIITGLQ